MVFGSPPGLGRYSSGPRPFWNAPSSFLPSLLRPPITRTQGRRSGFTSPGVVPEVRVPWAPPRVHSHWLPPGSRPSGVFLHLGPAPHWSGPQVVFEKKGVYLHTSAKKHQDPDSLISGVIRVVEKVRREGTRAWAGPERDGGGICGSLVWLSVMGP